MEDTIKPVRCGAGLKLYADCTMGHKTCFENCEHYNKGRTSVFDIKLAVLQLVIGLNMSQENFTPIMNWIETVCQTGLKLIPIERYYLKVINVFNSNHWIFFATKKPNLVMLFRYRCHLLNRSLSSSGRCASQSAVGPHLTDYKAFLWTRSSSTTGCALGWNNFKVWCAQTLS